MNTQNTEREGLNGVELPEVVKLRSGALIAPKSDHWKFIDGVRVVDINFHLLPKQVALLKDSLKRVLISVVEETSPLAAKSQFKAFKNLADVVADGSDVITVVQVHHVENFIALYPGERGMKLHLSAVMNRWKKLAFDGFSEEAES
jgi:hypothetical protein